MHDDEHQRGKRAAARPDDRELLAAWREGDRRAGSELFARHFDDLYGFFRNKVHAADVAEDLVQQTMLACVRNRDGFRGDASFRTYLFTIARSRLIDLYRRRARSDEPEGVSSLLDPAQSPSTWFRASERKQQLLAALGQLSFDHQLALELHYVQGFKGPELAAILDIPEGTVRSRLRRARAALVERLAALGEQGIADAVIAKDLEGWASEVEARAKLEGEGSGE